jgi:putative methionine-R-sulfoxide reductase with GAF domain
MTIDHDLLRAQAAALFDGERDAVANAANLSALVYRALPEVKPACVRIAFGAGVCGSAWAQARTIIVPDVQAFEGHIACDSASNAEIVVPLIVADGTVLAPRRVSAVDGRRYSESAGGRGFPTLNGSGPRSLGNGLSATQRWACWTTASKSTPSASA